MCFRQRLWPIKLKERGYSVHLVTDSRAERYAGKFPAEEIHVVPSATIGSKNPVAVARSLWTLWSGMRAAKKLMARLKPLSSSASAVIRPCRRCSPQRASACLP